MMKKHLISSRNVIALIADFQSLKNDYTVHYMFTEGDSAKSEI